MAVLRNEDVVRTLLFTVVARHHGFIESRERRTVERIGSQLHRFGNAKALTDVLHDSVGTDGAFCGAGARAVRLSDQRHPTRPEQKQCHKALLHHPEVQLEDSFHGWVAGRPRTSGPRALTRHCPSTLYRTFDFNGRHLQKSIWLRIVENKERRGGIVNRYASGVLFPLREGATPARYAPRRELPHRMSGIPARDDRQSEART